MGIRTGHLLAMAAVSFAASGAWAEDEIDTASLGTLQVWGTEINASSITLDDDTFIIKQADHISDLLRTIPGVDVGGAHSLNQRITIRSMDDKDLRITIDGANQNTYMYHHMGNLQIHADILKSVDIEVGNNSVINGGLGGAVRFETKSADDLLEPGKLFGGRVQGSYADNAANSYAVTGYGKLGNQLDILGYFNHVDRDNFEVGGGKIKDANGDKIAGTNGEVKGLKGKLKDALIKLGWDITPNQRLEIGYEAYEDKGNYSYRPDMGLAVDLAIADNLGLPLVYPTEFTRDTVTLNYDLAWGENSTLEATLFHNDSTLKRDESGVNAVFANNPTDVEGEAVNTGLNVLANTVLGQNTLHDLTYGVNVIKYDTHYKSTGSALGVGDSKEDATMTAIFLEDRIEFANGFSVIPGIRYEHFDLDSAVVDKTFSDVTFGLGFELAVGEHWVYRASTTQLFKAPEIGEVFIGAGLFDTANPDIKEETGYNSEIGFAFNDAVFGADNFSAGLTLFRTYIDDYIYDYAIARSVKANIGDMRIEGYESYAGLEVGNLSLLITYSDADSKLNAFSQFSAFEDARLDRKQGNTFSFNADYGVPSYGLNFHWDVLAVGDLEDSLDIDGASVIREKDGYTIHNISARWEPKQAKGLSLTLGVDNLFDDFYASHSSRTGVSVHPRFGTLYLQDYEPGRNIKFTVAYKF